MSRFESGGSRARRITSIFWLFNFTHTNVILDTSLNTDASDSITIISANNVHANTNLTINTGGTGTDLLTIDGSVANFAGNVLFQNAETVDINANVTAGANLTIEIVTTEIDIAAGVTLTPQT